MVDGKFKCMGSVQHLKTKFGEGYTLTVKLKEMSKHISSSNDYTTPTSLSSSTSHRSRHALLLHDDYDDENDNKNPLTPIAPGLSNNKYINSILNELKTNISSKCKLKERHFNNVYQFELPCPNPLVVSSSPTKNRINPQASESPPGSPASSSSSSTTTTTTTVEFNIGDVYRLIELNKLRFNIADYSLSQNTLDNVFINFVKEQTKKRKRQAKSGGAEKNSAVVDDDEDDQNYSSEDSDDENGSDSSSKKRKGTGSSPNNKRNGILAQKSIKII